MSGSNAVRDDQGCIITARNTLTGELWTLHEPGLKLEALRCVCERLDAASGSWLVVSYSSPATILGDLGYSRVQRHRSNENERIDTPELSNLGRIGRTDLIDPSLTKHTSARSGCRR